MICDRIASKPWGDGIASMRLADPDHAVFADKFKNRAQGVGRMKTIRTPQWRIGNSTGVHAHLGNLHWGLWEARKKTSCLMVMESLANRNESEAENFGFTR